MAKAKPKRPPLAQLLGPAKRAALQEALARLARQHHTALAVELFGADAVGLSAAELDELIATGAVDATKLGGFRVPGTNYDIFEFVARVARLLEATPIPEQAQMRRWSLRQWSTAVGKAAPSLQQKQHTPPGAVFVTTSGSSQTLSPPSAQQLSSTEAPTWMGAPDRAAWQQARVRGGEFCRGLGNRVGDDLEAAIAEAWSGEEIVGEVQPQLRADRVEQIREAVADALGTHRSSAKLASDLGHAAGNWAHNWRRIAETELQGALNEGVVLAALEDDGPGALIARVPETDACEDCERVFTGEDGDPLVWVAQDLIANGTNVGKPRKAWQATIWPVHPHCRCGTLSVPPGYRVTRSGALRRTGA